MRQGIRLLAFGDFGTQQLQSLARQLAQAGVALPGEQFSVPHIRKRPFLEQLSEDFSVAQVVLLLVQPERYLEIKLLLFNAMGLSVAADAGIRKRVGDEQKEHALIPQGATPFYTESGLLSGFLAREKQQYFFCLPADTDLLGEQLQNGLRAVLEQLPREAVQTTEPNPEESTVASVAEEQKESVIVSRLFASGLDVALAQAGSASAFLHSVEGVSGYEKVFIPVESSIEKGEFSRKRHTALLAKTARNESGCALGISISGVFESKEEQADENSLFCYIGIADETHVRVLKIYGISGEEPSHLRDEAITRMLVLLEQYAARQGFEPPPEMELMEEEEPRKRSLRLYLLLGVITLLLCIAVAFAVKAWYDGEQPTSPVGNTLLSAKESSTNVPVTQGQTTSNTSPSSDTEEDTQAPDSVSRDALSELMAQQLREDALQKRQEQSDTTTIPSGTTRSAVTTAPPHTTRVTLPGSAVQKSTDVLTTLPGNTLTTRLMSQGVFSFTTYGFGHGVGMSQMGAIALADQGKSCNEIVYYYFGLSPVPDSDTPQKVSYQNVSYSLPEYLARTVEAEIGGYAVAPEALKAQALVAYTYAKRFQFKGMDASKHAFSSRVPSEKTMQAVYTFLAMRKEADSPQGQYLAYKGQPALTPYFASAGGKTADVTSVWGGSLSDYPYLKGSVPAAEELSVRNKTLTAQQLRELVERYNQSPFCIQTITLQADSSKWIQILAHDQSVNSKVGYITQMRIGDVTMTGNHFRYYVLDMELRSHCFTWEYQK